MFRSVAICEVSMQYQFVKNMIRNGVILKLVFDMTSNAERESGGIVRGY